MASQMERIGKNMVEKCKRLPLAILSIGGILSGKQFGEWEMIDKDISFYLGEGGVIKGDEYYTVKQVLGLSYDSLPSRLRQCFLCLANFEEDEVIKTEELYILWMAEGLISMEHKAEGMMLLDVAESFLEELAHRSLVQVEKIEDKEISWSKYITCSVHDLIRDLCLSKAREEKFIKVVDLQPQPEESRASISRRLCINPYNKSMLKPYDEDVISHVRSLVVICTEFWCQWPDKILSLQKFKLLRIFPVYQFKFTKKDMEIISELAYLKCLRLEKCSVEELPSSISKLRNLEILDLIWSKVHMVANVLWKLKHLKFLSLPPNFKAVEKLRFKGLDELEVIYGYHSDNCDTYELIGLRKLKVLTGNFYMKRDADLGKSVIDFIKSRELRYSYIRMLDEELCLVSLLECCFTNVFDISGPICKFPKEYDHTRFSSRLTKLNLYYCRMREDPMILLEKLPNLCKLDLGQNAYLGTEMVCTANGFPKLQKLRLCVLEGLKQWRVEEGAMSNLSCLVINRCAKLEMLPEGLRYLASLESLSIESMPYAFRYRVQSIDKYKISHVPNLDGLVSPQREWGDDCPF